MIMHRLLDKYPYVFDVLHEQTVNKIINKTLYCVWPFLKYFSAHLKNRNGKVLRCVQNFNEG